MHMADALLSPTVGATMWVAASGLLVYSARMLNRNPDHRRVPLMGVLGAFIFAAQMINFSIPGTGSSGHIGGGMILAVLLGPYAAFLTIASILAVQALFFADGGLLALGSNMVNLGFFPCFVAYSLVYKRLAGAKPTQGRIALASVAACVLGLQMGAFGVVLETVLSGVSDLAFSTFTLLMQPIHLAIGIIEGLVTASVVTFIAKAHPEVMGMAQSTSSPSRLSMIGEDERRRLSSGRGLSMRNLVAVLFVLAAVTGGVLSWFASDKPDGLEWAMFHTLGQEEIEAPREHRLYAALADIQQKTALLPDYQWSEAEPDSADKGAQEADHSPVNLGTSLAGLVGTLITMGLTAMIGFGLRYHQRRQHS